MNEEEIKKELEQLPKEWLAVFGARSATQCLPGLLHKVKRDDPPFACWDEEERLKELINLLWINAAAECFSARIPGKYSVKKSLRIGTKIEYFITAAYGTGRAGIASLRLIAACGVNARY